MNELAARARMTEHNSLNNRTWQMALADARFEREFDSLRTRLARLARFKYRLRWEDCEELAADALHAWHESCAGQAG